MVPRHTRFFLAAIFLKPYLSSETLGSITKGTSGSRIAGGHEAIPASHPWQVMLAIVDPVDGQPKFHCGGSILSKKWVITASHCLKGHERAKWKIIAGLHGIMGMHGSHVQMHDVENFHLHPKFKSNPTDVDGGKFPDLHFWDVALMKVQREIVFTEEIAPICLPKPNDEKKFKTKNISNFVASGWGKIRKGMMIPHPPSQPLPFKANIQTPNLIIEPD